MFSFLQLAQVLVHPFNLCCGAGTPPAAVALPVPSEPAAAFFPWRCFCATVPGRGSRPLPGTVMALMLPMLPPPKISSRLLMVSSLGS